MWSPWENEKSVQSHWCKFEFYNFFRINFTFSKKISIIVKKLRAKFTFLQYLFNFFKFQASTNSIWSYICLWNLIIIQKCKQIRSTKKKSTVNQSTSISSTKSCKFSHKNVLHKISIYSRIIIYVPIIKYLWASENFNFFPLQLPQSSLVDITLFALRIASFKAT